MNSKYHIIISELIIAAYLLKFAGFSIQLLIFTSVIIIVNELFFLYKDFIIKNKEQQLLYIGKSYLVTLAFIYIFTWFYEHFIIHRLVNIELIFGFITCFYVISLLFRLSYASIYKYFWYNKKKILVITNKEEADELYVNIFQNNREYSVQAYILPKNCGKPEKIPNDKVIYVSTRNYENILREIHKFVPQYILIGDFFKTKERTFDFIDFVIHYDVTIYLSSMIYEETLKKIEAEQIANKKVFIISNNRKRFIETIISKMIYRIFDITLSITGLIILSPVFAITALLIHYTDKGPIFYKHVRIGRNGEPFDFWKFRSLKVVDEETGKKREEEMIKIIKENPQLELKKMVNEDRQYPVGKFIRKTSIDELPQLWNVLKGDMSIVGPRPCLPYEWEAYNNWQKRRLHSVKPGCTGVWQVYGKGKVSYDEMIMMDLYYIENKSLLFDIELIVKTFPIIFKLKGDE